VKPVRRVLFAGYYRLGRSSFAIVCDARPVAWAMGTLSEMTLADVVEVLDALEQRGVQYWLAGGWGIDALLGRPMRRHVDLALLLPCHGTVSADPAVDALRPLGFRPVMSRPASLLMPGRVIVADGTGRAIDLLPLDVRRRPFSDHAREGTGPTVRAVLDGRTVDCLCAPLQLELHEGTPLRRSVRVDIAALWGYAAAMTSTHAPSEQSVRRAP